MEEEAGGGSRSRSMDFGACEEPTRKKLSKQGQSRSCTLTPLSPSECETTTSCAPQLLSRSYSAGSSSVGDVHGVERRRSEGAGARLSRKVKEQRARFYIMRRCIHMLVCWRDDTRHY